MRPFLDDFITTLSGRRQVRVYDLLRAAQVQKDQIEQIAKQLDNPLNLAQLSLSMERVNDLIDATRANQSISDIFAQLSTLYNISNLISLLLDSETAVLSSEIKVIEDQIVAMEKAAANYAFLLSDAGAYDYSLIETFNDEVLGDINPDVDLSDRAGRPFGSSERLRVNSQAGILTLAPSLSTEFPMTATVLKNNCFGFATSDTGINNALNKNVGSGWRVSISSPRPINSNLLPGKTGAQALVECTLVKPSPCDTIVLVPFSDTPVEILQITVYPDLTDNAPTDLLTESLLIDRPFNFSFSLSSVAKFKFLINQSSYVRPSVAPERGETQYRILSNSVMTQRQTMEQLLSRKYIKNKRAHQLTFLMSRTPFQAKLPSFFRNRKPLVDFDSHNTPLTLDKILYRRNEIDGQNRLWESPSTINNLVLKLFNERMGGTGVNGGVLLGNYFLAQNKSNLLSQNTSSSIAALSLGGDNTSTDAVISASQNITLSTQSQGIESNILTYDYVLGLRNITIGTSLTVFKGVWISKILPAPSDSGEVKIKTKDINYQFAVTQRDDPLVTSIEYCVTNKSNPENESDWIPILPVDQQTVESERLFFSRSGYASLRFPARTDAPITIYKNGYRLNVDPDFTFGYTNNKQVIVTIQLPLTQFTTSDVITCTYTPSGDPWTINFAAYGFDQISTSPVYDSSGSGQTFTGTNSDKTVALTYEPYIDYDQVNLTGSYGTTGFGGSYQPISIVMEDGTLALNYTNYLGGAQKSLSDISTNTIAYIQSGKNIVFNQELSRKFTIFYQYLPSNVRYRIVMRVNDTSFVSPVVDSIQVKTKIRKSDPRRIF
jgi:hypothetical protein